MLYLSKWKLIMLSAILALALGYVYLRYSVPQYQANATIKIKDDKNQNKLPEISTLQNYGLFKTDINNVLDEIEIIKSRTIIENVVRDLRFNIQYFVEGKFQGHEVYKNPPLNLTFSVSDSILNKVDTTFSIKINSAQDFYFKGLENMKGIPENKKSSDDGVLYAFGETVDAGFGEVIITPNIGQYATKIGSQISIKISPVKAITSHYKSKLSVETKENSSVIKLSIIDNVKEKAQVFLDRLIQEYNQDVVNDKQLVVEITSDFINKRLEIVSRELGTVDETAEDVQRSNKITDIGTQSTIALQKESQNEAQLIATSNQIQLVDYMTDYLGDNNTAADALPANIGINDNSVAQITKRHNELVLERNRILKSSSEINPTVVNLTNQIDALKDNLQQSLENIRTSSQITLDNLYAENARINSLIYSAPRKEREFTDIKRQQGIKEALYLYLLQKREESAITYGVSSPNAKIVDTAYASSKPVKPKPVLIFLAAFVFGLAIPILLIYLFNLLDFKVRSINDVKRVSDVPYIGDIPKSKRKSNMLVSEVDYSPKAEAFRMVRTNLDFMLHHVKDRGKIIFVTSTTSKEGKSHTCVNLATSLSYSGKKTLIIETDIRVPNASKYLKVKNNVGLTNYITDSNLTPKDVTVKVNDNNELLHVIPSGTIPPNPAELLMSDRMEKLFKEVEQEYDYILVDTAAVGLVTDTLLLTKFADLFIYVIKANYLDKRRLQIVKSMYEEKKLPHMTVLLNNVNHKKGYGYGYGYGKSPKKKK